MKAKLSSTAFMVSICIQNSTTSPLTITLPSPVLPRAVLHNSQLHPRVTSYRSSPFPTSIPRVTSYRSPPFLTSIPRITSLQSPVLPRTVLHYSHFHPPCYLVPFFTILTSIPRVTSYRSSLFSLPPPVLPRTVLHYSHFHPPCYLVPFFTILTSIPVLPRTVLHYSHFHPRVTSLQSPVLPRTVLHLLVVARVHCRRLLPALDDVIFP